MRKNTIATFWSRVDRTGSCWIWQGPLDRDGYGKKFNLNHTKLSPHRLSYILRHGTIPAGLCVCHSCDNRRCVNPDHLWLGTNQQNTLDRHVKGRTARGEKINHAKLTEQQVREIRDLKLTHKETAVLYGVTPWCIEAIRQRKTWRHI